MPFQQNCVSFGKSRLSRWAAAGGAPRWRYQSVSFCRKTSNLSATAGFWKNPFTALKIFWNMSLVPYSTLCSFWRQRLLRNFLFLGKNIFILFDFWQRQGLLQIRRPGLSPAASPLQAPRSSKAEHCWTSLIIIQYHSETSLNIIQSLVASHLPKNIDKYVRWDY